MTVEYEDLPGYGDICFGSDACEKCQSYNHPNPCPCGERTDDGPGSGYCCCCGEPLDSEEHHSSCRPIVTA